MTTPIQSQEPTQPGTTPPATPATPEPVTPGTPESFPKTWEDVFKHPRFQELNKRATDATAELERIKTEEKQRNDQTLAEQNRFKELYEGLQNELKTANTNNLRLKVANLKGLPAELVDRLRGETEADLIKDAESLMALMKPSDPRHGVPPIGPGGQTPVINLTTETDPAKVRAAIRTGSNGN